MKSQSTDWPNIARTGAFVSISGLHWLAHNTGKALLVCADKLDIAKQWVEPKAPRLRKARR